MNLYFYLVFPFLKNTVAFQLPLYIEASNVNDAKVKADSLLTALKNQFDILIDPSSPILLVPNVNQSRFDALISQINLQNSVTIYLPVNFGINMYQHTKTGNALSSVLAQIIVPGNHSNVYSL